MVNNGVYRERYIFMMSFVYHFCLYAVAPLLIVLAVQITPSLAQECLDCHAETLRQLRGTSHHIQGVEPKGKHCYACHWEATAGGDVDNRYHRDKDGLVDLVVWQEGSRPKEHESGRTAVAFRPAAIGTEGERGAVGTITMHCLSCHNDATSRKTTFTDDPNMPGTYAWDRESIASRYTNRGTTTWGKYSTSSTNKKQRILKALSPHGNAVANQGGWQAAVGYDGDMPLTRGGSDSRNVECYDCHNSHGSQVPGITSSYRIAGSGNTGGILKQTVAGNGGYRASYQPSTNTYAKSKNPFNPGAGLCFDCHENAASGPSPWGYTTFGLRAPVIGYKDTPGFGPGTKGSSSRFPNRHGRDDIASSHLRTQTPLNAPPTEQINGLCTPCHDPHGVSRTLGEDMAYAVPLLKGSWLTSPYREDGPPATTPGRTGSGIPTRENYNSTNREAGSNFAKGASTPPRDGDFNTVNRSAGSNFAKDGSSAPRGDFNAVNREAGSNFAKGASTPPRDGDFNTVNRSAGSNFAKGASTPPRDGDFNTVNRSAGSNFAKDGSSVPREGDFNAVNRDRGSNFARVEPESSREMDANRANRDANSNFAKSGMGSPREPMQGMKYNVDRNTFGADRRISENDDRFAGLCLKCHTKESLTSRNEAGMIHRTVKGWGSNKEHSFPCSKCHQAHNSGLPRLMQTNCFEQGPSGLRESSGISWLPYKKDEPAHGSITAQNSAPLQSNKIVGCHVKQFGKAMAGGQQGNGGGNWKEVTSW